MLVHVGSPAQAPTVDPLPQVASWSWPSLPDDALCTPPQSSRCPGARRISLKSVFTPGLTLRTLRNLPLSLSPTPSYPPTWHSISFSLLGAFSHIVLHVRTLCFSPFRFLPSFQGLPKSLWTYTSKVSTPYFYHLSFMSFNWINQQSCGHKPHHPSEAFPFSTTYLTSF